MQIVNRRKFLQGAASGLGCSLFAGTSVATPVNNETPIDSDFPHRKIEERFPHFQSIPVSYLNVRMRDTFWAPRQKTVCDVSLPWATRNLDRNGGLERFREKPDHYDALISPGWPAVEFIESMASVVGLQRDKTIEGLTKAWNQKMIAAQEADGYWPFDLTLTPDPVKRWQPAWWSHEDYSLGYYIDAAIVYREVTGDDVLYNCAVRAADNMASTLFGSNSAYAPGMPRIEEALLTGQ